MLTTQRVTLTGRLEKSSAMLGCGNASRKEKQVLHQYVHCGWKYVAAVQAAHALTPHPGAWHMKVPSLKAHTPHLGMMLYWSNGVVNLDLSMIRHNAHCVANRP